MRAQWMIVLTLVACKRDRSAAEQRPPSRASDDGAVTDGSGAMLAAPLRDAAAPVDAAIDSAAIDAPPPRPAAPDAFVIASGVAAAGKVLVASPKELADLVGMRLAFFDEAKQVCLATIGELMSRATCPTSSSIAELTDIEGDCTTAMYGIAPGSKLATLKVKKGSTAIEQVAAERFGEDDQRMYNSKAALEGLDADTVAQHSSTRVLEHDGMSPLVLAYGTIHGRRSIGAFAVSGTAETPELHHVISFAAPAPSRVVGAALDSDGNVDAVIAHASGTVYVAGGGTTVELVCGR